MSTADASVLLAIGLPLLIFFGGLYHLMKNTRPRGYLSEDYAFPAHAIAIGPRMPANGYPEMPYMHVWLHDRVLKMEFRNMPGVVIRMDSACCGELAAALNKLAQEKTASN